MTPRRSISRSSRRAMTLLEVLLAVTLLVFIAVSITSAINTIVALEVRARRAVAGYEVANRLMLEYLDTFLDKKVAMPDPSLPLEFGDHMYYWELHSDKAQMEINQRQNTTSTGFQGLSRYEIATITIYEAEETIDGPAIRGERLASLSRIFDPATARNPDAINRVGEEGIGIIIRKITGQDIPIPNAPKP
jgi:type II secretory pathway pseudopilin PulG